MPHFAGVQEMIAAGVADAAIVATPNELHVPVAATLLEAGLPVLLEKPIANTVAEAMALVAVGRRTGVPLLAAQPDRPGGEGGDRRRGARSRSCSRRGERWRDQRSRALAAGAELLRLLGETRPEMIAQ